MTNKFLCHWHLHIKFVDDTTAFEIIPRNFISLLKVFASDINNFTISQNMKLTLYYQQIKSVSISRGITLNLIRSYLRDRLIKSSETGSLITREASGSGLREAVLRDRPYCRSIIKCDIFQDDLTI